MFNFEDAGGGGGNKVGAVGDGLKSAERVSKDGGARDVVLFYEFKTELNSKGFCCGDGGMRGNSGLEIVWRLRLSVGE